jgi:hypothetical protein
MMNTPHVRRLWIGLRIALSAVLLVSLTGVAAGATTDPNPSPREIAHA